MSKRKQEKKGRGGESSEDEEERKVKMKILAAQDVAGIRKAVNAAKNGRCVPQWNVPKEIWQLLLMLKGKEGEVGELGEVWEAIFPGTFFPPNLRDSTENACHSQRG